MSGEPGLRERKKAATRAALHEAAVRLAVDRGVDQVTVEAIADAANVSRRTFSNYFSCKEEALFHGDVEWLHRLTDAVRERPADVPPWATLTAALETLAAGGEPEPTWLARRRRLRRHPALVAHQVGVYAALEAELAAALADRLAGPDAALRARVLAATFLATVRVAMQHWVEHPEGPLADTLSAALASAAPAGEPLPAS